MSARAVLVSSDLFFISKIKEAAASCGKEIVVARSQAALDQARLTVGLSGLLIIDLEKAPIALETLAVAANELVSQGWKVASFFSHVHVDTAEKAGEMGLGEVMPRSKFVRVLPELLAAL